jgi:hypothetical protein
MYFGGSKLDGMVLKDGNNNIFLGKLKKKEPTVFLSEDDGKYSAYSKICQASSQRQPVILTQEEKEKIDTEDTKNGSKSYSHALEYGSDPANKNFYICPRFWCLKTNAPISEKDALEGKCGKILPQGAKKVEPGHYVIEFNNAKQHRDKDGNYSENSPGFLEGKLHPKGLCMPCCFKKPWDSKSQIERRKECAIEQKQPENGEPGKPAAAKKAKKLTTKQETYIIDIRRYPIPQHRWGFLPISVQYFLQTDNSTAVHPDNNKYLREDRPVSTLLRYGIENSSKKSFIGCIADIYSYIGKREEVPNIEDMCQIISAAVSIDLFLKYHNGSLASIFRPKTYDIEDVDPKKYEGTSEFMDKLDQGNETHLDFIYDTIAAYESFVSFLTNPESYIDHTYLWDIVCSPNPMLFPTGLNLAILRIRNVDMTDDIELLCPTSVYSPVLFDSRKETVILIKHDEYFEPVYLFHSAMDEDKRTTKIQKTFKEGKSHIHEVLQIIRMSIETSCAPKSSLPPNSGMPKVYKFSKSLPAESLKLVLLKYKFVIKAQIINYHAKVVGLWVEANNQSIYIPCSPSSQLAELEKKFMDDDDLWVTYNETVNLLRYVHDKSKGHILCRPSLKIAEDGQVIGVLTETNQFIMISEPVDPIEDDIPLIEDENYIIADKVFAQSKTEDPKRVETVKKIILETQFYGAFRTTVRILLNDPVHNMHKQQIMKIIENRRIISAVDLIETILHTLCNEFVTFKEFDEEVLMNLGEISDCFTGQEDKRFCAIKDGRNQLVLPKKHLVSRKPNKAIYFARMADELWRYKRIQLFMMNSKMYLNLTNTEYKINADEMLMLESLLTADYFKSLEPYEHGNTLITYETANPIMSQKYSNEINQNAQQGFVKKDIVQDNIQDQLGIECILGSHPITGKKSTSIWPTFFSPKAVELDLHKTVKCSYYPIIYTYYEIHKTFLTVEQIKIMLIAGYSRQYSIYYEKVLKILRKQGKRDMVDDIRRGRYDLIQAITMEAYFLTPLDLWVLASLHELPIVLFHQKKLKNLLESENWVLLNKTKPNKYYFVRVPTEPDSPSNYLPQYSVVKPAVSASEMSGLFKKGNPASTVSLSEYFDKIAV